MCERRKCCRGPSGELWQSQIRKVSLKTCPSSRFPHLAYLHISDLSASVHLGGSLFLFSSKLHLLMLYHFKAHSCFLESEFGEILRRQRRLISTPTARLSNTLLTLQIPNPALLTAHI
ncbi:unnamed protein product [Tetraodon nigroviridis]|uniref:(spotted green pufferfish) hypothetical protein n=1 Tax=Tetraodon nigroviridis TaxID=99883 RepID=Q4S2X2_TETNG|nr:unnamed protein product [Tetraodon nigroviridis]